LAFATATLPWSAFSFSALPPAAILSSSCLSISVSTRLTKKEATEAIRSIGLPAAARYSRASM
jgi:hypothetical protein